MDDFRSESKLSSMAFINASQGLWYGQANSQSINGVLIVDILNATFLLSMRLLITLESKDIRVGLFLKIFVD